MNKITASIVLYNPDIERLRNNISAILPQVDKLYIFDNGSNIMEEEQFCHKNEIVYVKSEENVGIAKALNEIVDMAQRDGYEWVLTLDQDSIAPTGLIEEYNKYINYEDLGMICCKIVDRNFGERIYNQGYNCGTEYVKMCITSASAIRIPAWKQVGGFCEKMFIDSVDFDICLSLIEQEYRILRTNNVQLLHEVGHSQKVNFLGKEELVFNHNPLRCYYMVRNELLLGMRHGLLLRHIGLCIKRIILINRFEEDRLKKNKMIFRGFYHAIIGRYGKL
ncbi:glycosyltransferase family 2 protein [Bacteroides reticulotermitis]|uniref:glycosyltransferase family 2 protein n=1 Tax=Bacteroides reticulotermitis TaxID=1133319 RepID=UPI003A89D918